MPSAIKLSFVFMLFSLQCRQDIGLLLRDKRLSAAQGGDIPAVQYTTPGNNVDAIATNAKISIVFSTAMQAASITTNTGTGVCSGTLQLSADNFSTCVPIAAAPAASADLNSFTITPQTALTANTLYKIRVSSGAQSTGGQGMASDYATPVGFRTGPGTDTKGPVGPQAAGFIVPYNADVNIFLRTKIILYFLEPILPSSFSVNTADNQCTGSIRLSSDGFITCRRFKAQAAVSENGRIFTLTPADELAPSTSYQIGVRNSITDLAGNAFAGYTSTFTTGTASSGTPNSVAGTSPLDGATNVSINTFYQITINRPIDPATLGLNFADSRCSGAIQISADGFSSCVRFDTRVTLSESFNDIYLLPYGALGNSQTYRIRVTTDLKDALGDSVSAFTQTTGFTTQAAVTGAPVVEHIYPFDGSTLMNVLAPFGAVFSKAMNPATLTINTTNTSCVGGYSFQVSADNFTTCLRLASITQNPTNGRFFVYPALPLAANTLYRTRLTIGAQDTGGLLNTLFTSSGVTTEP